MVPTSWSVMANMSSIASTYCGHLSRLRQSSSMSFQLRNGIVAAGLESLELLLLADLQPELHHDHALHHEAAFELHDLVVGAHPLLARGEVLDALDQYPAVPAAVEHAHPALPGTFAQKRQRKWCRFSRESGLLYE